MSRYRWPHLVWIVVLLPGLASAREIVWNPDRPITWADFEAPVPSAASPENVAVTAAVLRWSYEFDVEYSRRSCTWRITDIRSSATFDTQRSWARPDRRTPDVLTHERGHFDITRIHKLIFDALARDHTGTTGNCEASDVQEASTEARGAIAEILQPLYERVWSAHVRVQDTYDAETRHGMDAESQRRWLELIEAGLNGRRWAELGTLDPAP